MYSKTYSNRSKQCETGRSGTLRTFFTRDFSVYKKVYPQILKFLPIPPNIPMTPSHTRNNYIKITLKKYAYKSENILTIPFHTKKK